jgi:galactitol-specific phosphotransferase system IIC component
MNEMVRTILARVSAVLVGLLVAYVAKHFGVDVSQGTQDFLKEGITILGMGVIFLVYAIVHKPLSHLFEAPRDGAALHEVKTTQT